MLLEIAFVIHALYFISPAYLANSLALLFGGGRVIDGNRKFIDNLPVLGKGKTWRGAIVGIAGAAMLGLAFYVLTQHLSIFRQDFGGVNFAIDTPLFGLVVGAGAIVGDLVKSFFKRRLDIEQGRPLWGADQLDFVLGAMLFVFLFIPAYMIPIREIIVVMVATPLVHLLGNNLAFWRRKKGVRW